MPTSKHPDLESQDLTLRRATASLKAAQEDLEYAQDLFVDAAHKALQVATVRLARPTGLHLPQLRDVMCGNADPGKCQWAANPVRVLGSGPWEQLEFSRFLSAKGFLVAGPSDAVATLVLGSQDFDEEDLKDLLSSLDDSIPIYTQELLVCGLVRQKDPYALVGQEAIDAVARSHPGVALILRLGRIWPLSPDTTDGKYDEVSDESSAAQENEYVGEVDASLKFDMALVEGSPLHKFGYSTRSDGPDEWSRHGILERVFITHSLPGLTQQNKQRWGAAGSTKRLQAMSSFLASLAAFRGHQAPGAREKSISDLYWLQARYYRSTMGFEWPEIPDWKVPKRVLNAAHTRSVKPDAVLAAVIGPESLTRNEVVAKLWDYIRKHNLQDSENKKIVNADDKLRALFGKDQISKDQISMYQIQGMINRHVC